MYYCSSWTFAFFKRKKVWDKGTFLNGISSINENLSLSTSGQGLGKKLEPREVGPVLNPAPLLRALVQKAQCGLEQCPKSLCS